MSERAAGQSQPGSSTSGNDAGRPLPNSSPPLDQHAQNSSRQNLPSAGSSSSTQTQPPPPPGIQLPPLPQAANVTSGSFPPPPRTTGISSILNPPEEDEPSQSRRRKADQLESPPSSVKSLPPLFRGEQPGTRPAHAQTSAGREQYARPTLTPRSPSFRRSTGPYQFNPPTGTIPAQQSPFPVSPRTRAYTLEPSASDAPPNPVSSNAARQTPTFPAPTPPSKVPRGVSESTARVARGPSSSASPSTSYSGFSQAGRTSPAMRYTHASGIPTVSSSSYLGGSEASTGGPVAANAPPTSGPFERQRPLGIPISSAGGQNVYQMMTLETTSGTVQLPVDVQAASRVADEKRKRNAGASARFRQRRKEKERESSTTISKLEQQVKALGEDADFYKRERDYFAGVVLQVQGGERHFPRPQSPRHRRSSSVFASGSGSQGYASGPEQMAPQSPQRGRNVRRRTSTISLPAQSMGAQGPPVGQTMTPRFAAAQGYVGVPMGAQHQTLPPALGPLPSPLGRINLPGSAGLMPAQHHQAQPPPGPSQLMQAPPQTGPWNPYASDRRPPLPPHTQPQDRR